MGKPFGPFDVLARLGGGGMGITSVAERAGPAGVVQRVCLKRLTPDLEADPDFVRLFQLEARVVAMLRHANVVQLLDFGREGETWWMALELVEGIDLRALLRVLRKSDRRMPSDVVVFVACELAKALAYAHARVTPEGAHAEIVHRDVTPANVLLSYEGEVKLTDFGIAKVVYGDRTRTGIKKGKDGYMSREQCMAEPVDHRTDLFSLGLCVFEMLGRGHAFEGESEMTRQVAIMKGERRDLRAAAPDAPAPLLALLDRLLRSERGERPRSAIDILDALAPIAPAHGVERRLAELVRAAKPGHVEADGDGITEIEPRSATKRR